MHSKRSISLNKVIDSYSLDSCVSYSIPLVVNTGIAESHLPPTCS